MDCTRTGVPVAIVTGSTRGIGKEIANRLAREGYKVVINGRDTQKGEKVAKEIREEGGSAAFVQADLQNEDEIKRLIKFADDEFGSLDLLVNNAAVQTYTRADEASMEDWDLVINTDVRSFWLTSKYASEVIETGAIINISSNHSILTQPKIFPYNAAKSAVNGMTRAMALEWGPRIRVNAVVSGWVVVERTAGDMADERRYELEAKHPVGRMGKPEDIAGVVSFLASSDSAFITGECINVDGGRSIIIEDSRLPDYRKKRESL